MLPKGVHGRDANSPQVGFLSVQCSVLDASHCCGEWNRAWHLQSLNFFCPESKCITDLFEESLRMVLFFHDVRLLV